jgi:predicted small lipoprotein YifL
MSQLATRASLMAIIVGTCLASICLAGCGQKGNLYLPNQKKKVPTTTSQPDTPAAPVSH